MAKFKFQSLSKSEQTAQLISPYYGLLGRRELASGEGMAFREKSIHMFAMRMPLDMCSTSRIRICWRNA